MKGISLHIALNFIDKNHYNDWDGKLNFCESDASLMESIASKMGYSKIEKIVNEEATRENVIDKINSAAEELIAGDIFLVTYSGHGGQVGDIDREEADKMDETWCLFNGQLIDDELFSLWKNFKEGVRILVISDSCHSGTVSKEAITDFNANFQQFLDQKQLVSRNMPLDHAVKVYKDNRQYYDNLSNGIGNKDDEIKATVKLISGCQDNQKSYEGFGQGQFTDALNTVWSDGSFTGNYSDFHAAILKFLPAYQSPNLYNIGAVNSEFANNIPFSIT